MLRERTVPPFFCLGRFAEMRMDYGCGLGRVEMAGTAKFAGRGVYEMQGDFPKKRK